MGRKRMWAGIQMAFTYTVGVFICHLIYIPHTSGSCPESTEQNPAVVALSVVLAIVVVLLAVAILTIILLYTSESDIKVQCKYV